MSFLRPRIIRDPAPLQWLSEKIDDIHDRRMRWVEVLRENPNRELWLHRDLEGAPERFRWMVLGGPSALTLATADPMLRHAGLTNDRFIVGTRFFGLSFRKAHHILCYCNYGHEVTVPARLIVRRIVETFGEADRA